MNKIFFLLLFSFSAKAQFLPIIGAVNEHIIRKTQRNVNAKFSVNFTETQTAAIADLKDVLSSYSQGQTITIQKNDLAMRNGQSFYISADSINVILGYTTNESLENAVYTYLDLLGIRWYNAGANWLYKPSILNTVNIAGQWQEPTFRNRIFAGTGGLATPLPVIDPNFNYANNWYAWKRRIRMSADFYDVGHSGEAFYTANRAVLDANPNWFTSTASKIEGRLKIDSAAAVQVYKTWVQTRYNAAFNFNTIGTDPADGRGGPDDPLPANGFYGINNWNSADKTWWLTNEVAKLYDSNNTKIQITAYAYGDGPTVALVPKFMVKKNVYPIIIPYAFQTSYLPDQMVKTWARSISGKMGLYDYWNITQWSIGLPQFNIYEMSRKLKFWAANKVNGMNIETTDASGPMGHIWWLGAQMEFDVNKNVDTLFNKYLADCFGPAAQPMKDMYLRWSLNYQGNGEVNLSLKNLYDATQLVTVNGAEWKRINDVKAYLHFMKMMAQRTGTQTYNDSIYQYIYSIHQRMLVQTQGIVGERYLGIAPIAISSHQLTETEVENNFNADLAALPVQYTISNFLFNYDKVSYVDPLTTWNFALKTTANFKANFTGTVSISAGTQSQTQVRIFAPDSLYINELLDYNTNYTYTDSIADGNKWHMKTFTFNVVQGQNYSIFSSGGFGRLQVNTPNIVLLSQVAPDDFDNYAQPVRYFYVPIGTTEIAFSDNIGSGNLITSTGQVLTRLSTNIPKVYKVTVPAGQDGKIWKASFAHTQWRLLNIPNIQSLQNFSYTE